MTDRLTIPDSLLPVDGRFGAGPSKVREEQMGAVARAHRQLMGTSHRQAPVRGLVGGLREGLGEFLRVPDGYEILLGMGGASAFWDAAALGLVRERAQHAAFGEFGAKFAEVTDGELRVLHRAQGVPRDVGRGSGQRSGRTPATPHGVAAGGVTSWTFQALPSGSLKPENEL